MVLTSLALLATMQTKFGELEGTPVSLYTLKNKNGMVAKIMDYGATVVSLTAPDRTGKLGEVTLGFPEFEPYPEKSPYFGCTVGRFGNRIAKGKFKIDGKEYDVDSLSADAKAQLQSLNFIDNELAHINAQVAAYKTARIAYARALSQALQTPIDPLAQQLAGDTIKLG